VTRRLRLLIVAAAVWLGPQADAGAAPEQAPADSGGGAQEAEPPPTVTYRAGVEWISAARWLEPARTALNPGNRRFGLPQAWLQTEARPSLRLELGSRVIAVVRPRLVGTAQWTSVEGSPRRATQDASANWTELYVNWRPGDAVQVTYGLQNFQWGPAELLAPSNRLFHETGFFRDQLYYVRGRHLLRVNLSAGKAWSAVALAELTDNGEDPFTAGEPFRRQGQAKLEYSSPSGRGYLGGTVGARQGAPPWFGQYAAMALTEGLSAYADASHTRGSRAWYPVPVPGGAAFARRDIDAGAWRTLAVAGLRYTFAAGPDARVEYLYNGAGYAEREFALAAAAAASARSAEALAPYFSPGLEFTGRRLALVSLRLPDLPPRKRVVVHGRYLRSLADRSGAAFVTSSVDASGSLVVFASATVTHGGDAAEFSRLARATVVAGTVWTW
jgi:hypothetical protein